MIPLKLMGMSKALTHYIGFQKELFSLQVEYVASIMHWLVGMGVKASSINLRGK